MNCSLENEDHMKFDQQLSDLLATLKTEQDAGKRQALVRQSIERLRSLEGPQFTTGHCENKAQPGGCQLHNLHCGYPNCDRRPAPANTQVQP